MAEKKLIGNSMAYVFKKDSSLPQNKKVIVSAHGTVYDDMQVDTPAGVWHTSSIGNKTSTQVRDIVKASYRNTILQNTFPKSSKNSKSGENVWSRKLIPCKEKDYLLTRYANNSEKFYKTINGRETFKYYAHVADNRGFDIISPRYDQKQAIIRLSTIIDYIKKQKYEEIWFNFCIAFYKPKTG